MSFSTPPPCRSPRQNHGRVRAAVLFGRARQIRPSRERRAAGPDDGLAAFDGRREQLVLEIAVQQAALLHELHHARGLGGVAAERLLARHGHEPRTRGRACARCAPCSRRACSWGRESRCSRSTGSSTIASSVGNAWQSPTPSPRASAAASSARAGVGLHTPRMSPSRTACHEWMWNRVMKPLPMNPTPRRLPMSLPPSQVARKVTPLYRHRGRGVRCRPMANAHPDVSSEIGRRVDRRAVLRSAAALALAGWPRATTAVGVPRLRATERSGGGARRHARAPSPIGEPLVLRQDRAARPVPRRGGHGRAGHRPARARGLAGGA